VVAVSRDGQVESSFEPERFKHLMERFNIAYSQIQISKPEYSDDQDLERAYISTLS